MGLTIDFRHSSPDASDLGQLAVHIAICAVIVYFIGYAIERVISYIILRSTRPRSHDP